MWSIRRSARPPWPPVSRRAWSLCAKASSRSISKPHLRRFMCASARPPVDPATMRAASRRRAHQMKDRRMPSLAARRAISDEPASMAEPRAEHLRLIEALLFASAEPLDAATLAARLPEDVDVAAALTQLKEDYAGRGVNLVNVAGKWTFRTANDLSWLLAREAVETRKLSRAALETLAIIAYHQPVTRAEIEDIRGVTTSKGTLDVLLETGWIRPRGRRKTPGRPITFGTTEAFLTHFGLEAVNHLPGLEELKGAGLFDGRLPADFSMPAPSDDPTLREDEDPLEAGDLDLGLAPRPSRLEEE